MGSELCLEIKVEKKKHYEIVIQSLRFREFFQTL